MKRSLSFDISFVDHSPEGEVVDFVKHRIDEIMTDLATSTFVDKPKLKIKTSYSH